MHSGRNKVIQTEREQLVAVMKDQILTGQVAGRCANPGVGTRSSLLSGLVVK